MNSSIQNVAAEALDRLDDAKQPRRSQMREQSLSR
jgi:hypothetical protein